MERSQGSSTTDVTQLFSVIEQRSLEREISRVRHELEMTEKKTSELEQRVKKKQKFRFVDHGILFSLKIPMKRRNLILKD
jgi:hypothetical protein